MNKLNDVNNIAIYGAGGLGREVALLISQINGVKPMWKFIGFFDDQMTKGQQIDGSSVLGGMDDLNQYNQPLALAVAIAAPSVRKEVVSKIRNERVEFPTLIHPGANTGSDKNGIGHGCIITAGCILTTGICIEDFVMINLATTIGHDAVLGQFTSVMPGCHISGNVKMGSETLMGTGASILQNITIGANSIIGAGAVVTKSFPSHSKLVGVPATNRSK
ncbi:acetyltransferase [Flammeovirgaceae bacterium]